jgi:hypothetical protein
MDSTLSTTSAQKSPGIFISLAVASVGKIVRASQSVIANNVLDVIYQNNSQLAFEAHCKVRLALTPGRDLWCYVNLTIYNIVNSI